MKTELELTLPDSAATEALGAALARSFPGAADVPAALYLEGDLGAGKTTCVRSMLRTQPNYRARLRIGVFRRMEAGCAAVRFEALNVKSNTTPAAQNIAQGT